MTTDESLDRPLAEHGADAFRTGQIIGAKYRVTEMLGRGGMGVVYHVHQIFMDRDYALKTLDKCHITDLSMRRFQLEAKAASVLDHPNLVQVHDFGLLDDGQPFLIMDFVDGMTMADRLKRSGPIGVEDAVRIFAQVCFGLSYAHDQGIVHRDIKPSNIMLVRGARLGDEGSVKVLDFGIAKLMMEDSQALTRTGEICGSPFYMSPEQCAGTKVDHRSDIYSLGCVLYESLTGAPPHMGTNPLTTMMLHQNQPALPMREASLGKQFPPALEEIVGKMLRKSPDERYQKLGLVAHDLSMVLRGQATVVTKTPDSARVRETVKMPALTPAKTVSLKVGYLWAMAIGICATSLLFGAVAGYHLLLWQLQSAVTPGQDRSADKSQSSAQTAEKNVAATKKIDDSPEGDSAASAEWLQTYKSHMYLGDVARDSRDFDRASEQYEKALALLDGHNRQLSDEMADVLLRQGIVAFSCRDTKKALELFNTSLNIRTKLHGLDSPTTAETESWLANVYCSNDLKRYKQALECYQKAENLAKKGGPELGKVYARVLHNYGVCLGEAHRPKEAIEKLKQSTAAFSKYLPDDPERVSINDELMELMTDASIHKR